MQDLMPIEIVEVADRGVPNRERILLRAKETCQANSFFLGLGIARAQSTADPINDNMFWLGGGVFLPGDWMFVYTGRGMPNIHEIPNQTGKIFTYFWGKSSVVFSSKEIIPYLVQIGAAQIASPFKTEESLEQLIAPQSE